ncbi:MAG: glycosyltransferase family 2 protein, partial [Aquihabitans sp.]
SPTISAVVCTHTLDRWDALVRAVDSLREQTTELEEILVVVDHNDELLKRAATELDGATVVANAQQRGLAGARNTAIERVSSDVVAFLDDDAWAEADWAEHLVAVYEDRSVVAVGGAVEPAWATERPEWFPREFDWVVGCTYKGLPTVRSRVRNLIGANMSFRTSSLAEVGSFDELLGRVGANGAGCEETELCIRLTQHDPEARIILEPQARVRHEVPEQRTTFDYFKQRCRAEGASKAVVSQLVGSDDALSSERAYLTRTLAVGAVRGFGRLLWLDTSGVKRSGAMVVGAACVGRTYVGGSLRRASGRRRRS